MKKFLQFAGLIGAVLGIVAFILFTTTNAIVSTGTFNGYCNGTAVIFGRGQMKLAVLSGDFEGNPAWVALVAWIFILVAILVLACLFVASLLKSKALKNYDRLLTFVAGGLLIAAGILAFFSIPAFYAANNYGEPGSVALGAGWIIASILSIVGGGIAVLPPVLSLASGK